MRCILFLCAAALAFAEAFSAYVAPDSSGGTYPGNEARDKKEILRSLRIATISWNFPWLAVATITCILKSYRSDVKLHLQPADPRSQELDLKIDELFDPPHRKVKHPI